MSILTWMTAIVFEAGRCFVGHVGDSRYLYRDGAQTPHARPLSVNQLIKAFNISEAEASARAGKNVLVQSLGLDDDVVPEVLEIELVGDFTCVVMACPICVRSLQSGDNWVLATDLRETSQALVDLANSAGGRDGIRHLIRFSSRLRTCSA